MEHYFKDTEYTVKNLINFTNREEVFLGNPSVDGKDKSFSLFGTTLCDEETGLEADIASFMDAPVQRLVCPGMPYEGISVWRFKTAVDLLWVEH